MAKVDSPLYRLPANFGKFGGRFASETLMGALDELEIAYSKLRVSIQKIEKLKIIRTILYFKTKLNRFIPMLEDLLLFTIANDFLSTLAALAFG